MSTKKADTVLWSRVAGQFDGFRQYQDEFPRGAGKVFKFGRMK